ncbi:kinase-like domain-containing protein, partial [Tanacetum coccineum]
MIGSEAPQVTLLSDKLSLVTHHHLLTRVPVKLDLDDWNYGSWEYFFDQLCFSYDVSMYIHGNPSDTATSNLTPRTPEELKVDKIFLSWIFSTLSDALQKRLVVARPKTAKEAWDFISNIVKDNKQARTSALKAELRSITLGDLIIEAYFRKIESLMTIAGLPAKYDQVCGYMHYRDTFPDLKTVRSLLVTEEMSLKTKVHTLPADSSSRMVLVAESGNSRRSSSTPHTKPWKPCFNFAKGLRRLVVSSCRKPQLPPNKFSGVIPTNLSSCSNLELLYLGQNNLAGSIPKEISLLSKLSLLVIQLNKLTGGIPSFLGNITSMEMFSAVENPLGGSIPDTLGLWKSLTAFYSGGCNLYGSIPPSIFNLSLLVTLTLADNHLTGSLPSEIGSQLPNLELLQLWGNELTGVLPASISNCSKLRWLEMTNNNFSGKLTIDFSKLRDINSIRLSNNNLHGRGEADDLW